MTIEELKFPVKLTNIPVKFNEETLEPIEFVDKVYEDKDLIVVNKINHIDDDDDPLKYLYLLQIIDDNGNTISNPIIYIKTMIPIKSNNSNSIVFNYGLVSTNYLNIGVEYL